MKLRFSTYDLMCIVAELKKFVGMRVNQVYDIDNKTYLIRLQKMEEKVMMLLESGNRIHTTVFEWPKNPAPSGFSMKLRKHIKNKRLESVNQLGIDRIVDLQFGSGEAAHHVILELFDKGNIMLTDHELIILYVLRPHTQGDLYKFAVREKYPVDRARLKIEPPDFEKLKTILETAKKGDFLRRVLTPELEFGPALIEHALLGVGLSGTSKIGIDVIPERDANRILNALAEAEGITSKAVNTPSQGYIIQKAEKRPLADGGEETLMINVEFHPMLFRQHTSLPYLSFETFDRCVDVYFSSLESQKIDMKVVQQERDAFKKLENVRRDHEERLKQLEQSKEADKYKAELITKNQEMVDQAIRAVRTMIANQMPWPEIQSAVKLAASQGDSVASSIKALKLEMNHIVLQLFDPYNETDENEDKTSFLQNKPILVDIDLDLTAFANARKYYDQKRTATKKQLKTLESQGKALKSAEKKTKKSLKEMKNIVKITKARKVYWFEKFFWFISSENYLVIGGRDAVQNELIVKRYMRSGDVYVHADIHGASSIVIKNPTKQPIPPKTLNEAGIMAICYSVAWEAKVVTEAWWVNAEQVLKSAPAGEYLPTGSFSIRGKKNYLPNANLILGFSFLFKLEDSSIARHADERKVRSVEEELSAAVISENEVDQEIVLSEGEEQEDEFPESSEYLAPKEDTDEPANSNFIADESSNDESDESTENLQKEETLEENKPQQDGLFPDTEIKITHSGKEISLEAKPSIIKGADEQQESVVYLGDEKPVTLRGRPASSNKSPKNPAEKKVQFQPAEKSEKHGENKLKRGQRYKLKKIKEKYKDQDEEDRQLRMEFLEAAKSNKKESRKSKKKEAALQAAEQKSKKPNTVIKPRNEEKRGELEWEEQETSEAAATADMEIINSLTGMPHPEDELLFAVPVVAPYSTMQNYKFKVKLTPGTGKRGKAARNALDIFLKDKSAIQREKDLLKGVKDEDLAKNIPGKVKLSAPQLHKK